VIKHFKMPSSLTAREAEVLSDQVMLCVGDEVSHFQFSLENGFLPTISWSERCCGLLSLIVKEKKTVVMLADRQQRKSLRRCGFHLIADIVDSNLAV
jgi:hypothetical protein